MRRVVLLAAAQEELISGSEFYNARRAGSGDEFIDTVNHAARLIADFPYIGVRTKRGARRFVLAKFHYTVLYRVHSDRITVTNLIHHSREWDY